MPDDDEIWDEPISFPTREQQPVANPVEEGRRIIEDLQRRMRAGQNLVPNPDPLLYTTHSARLMERLQPLPVPQLRFVTKIGIEMEGAWEWRLGEIHHDGSVRVETPRDRRCEDWITGEISTNPTRKLDDVKRYMAMYYPVTVNDTCGLHIHLSFDSTARYQQLMDESFWNYFLDRMHKYFSKIRNSLCDWERNAFHARLSGLNRYCKREWHPDKQANAYERCQERYAQLNFCYTIRGTLECRLLPMFNDVAIAWQSILEYIDIVESWLADHKSDFVKVLIEHDRNETDFGSEQIAVPKKFIDDEICHLNIEQCNEQQE